MLDQGRIKMPAGGYWQEARKQLVNYKLLDRKIEQDIVMSLAIIAKLCRSAPRSISEPTQEFVIGAPDDEERDDPTVWAGRSRTARRLAKTLNR
jgi:hypothetical protein